MASQDPGPLVSSVQSQRGQSHQLPDPALPRDRARCAGAIHMRNCADRQTATRHIRWPEANQALEETVRDRRPARSLSPFVILLKPTHANWKATTATGFSRLTNEPNGEHP